MPQTGYEPGVSIVRGASITVSKGEIVVVLGPNGAGKSSFIKAIAGLVPVTGGTVLLDGKDITAAPAHTMVRLGLAFVPQTENIFPLMSVEDNLKVACGILERRDIPGRVEEMYTAFPDLVRQRRTAAGNLSGGQRQMLAVARALIIHPKVQARDTLADWLAQQAAPQEKLWVRINAADTGWYADDEIGRASCRERV